MQCVAVCCSALQCVAVCCGVLRCVAHGSEMRCNDCLWGVAVSCSVLRCVAVCWSVLQCVAVCCSVMQCVVRGSGDAMYLGITIVNPRTVKCCKKLQYVAACCSVPQRVATWSRVLPCAHCVAVCCRVSQWVVKIIYGVVTNDRLLKLLSALVYEVEEAAAQEWKHRNSNATNSSFYV